MIILVHFFLGSFLVYKKVSIVQCYPNKFNKKKEVNTVNNIVRSLHGERWLLELVGWPHCKV